MSLNRGTVRGSSNSETYATQVAGQVVLCSGAAMLESAKKLSNSFRITGAVCMRGLVELILSFLLFQPPPTLKRADASKR